MCEVQKQFIMFKLIISTKLEKVCLIPHSSYFNVVYYFWCVRTDIHPAFEESRISREYGWSSYGPELKFYHFILFNINGTEE